MKGTKTIALLLSVSMLAGLFAGCSKTTKMTTDKFVSACSKMRLEELDAEEHELKDSIGEGLYVYAYEDEVDDIADLSDWYLNSFGLEDLVDTRDVESFALALQVDGYEDLHETKNLADLEDLEIDGAFAMQITLNGNCAEDVMDNLKDISGRYDIKAKNLTPKEYYAAKNEGYFRFHIDISKLSPVLIDSDEFMKAAGKLMDEDDIEDLAQALTGDLAVSVEVNGNTIFVIAGVSLNTKNPNVYGSFAKAFGAAQNPMKLSMNEKLAANLADTAFTDFIASFSRTTIISIEDFEDACENDLELHNYDFFNIKDLDPIDVENGIYLVSNEAMTDLIRNGDTDSIAKLLREFDLDDIIDSDDVESFGFALICKGLEDLRYSSDPDEFSEAEADGALALVMTLSDSDYAEDIMDFLEDKLDDLDIDVDDLTSEEYYCSEDEGYLRFHMDINKFIELFFENDEMAEFLEYFDDDEIVDLLRSLNGDIEISIEVNETNVFVLIGFSLNTEPAYIDDFADAFGAAENPLDIPMNEEVTEDLIDYIVDVIL